MTQEFRNTWMSVLTITPEDNSHYNKCNEEDVLTWLRLNSHRTLPHSMVDSRRLMPDYLLTMKIEAAELRTAINKTKNTSPDQSKICKKHICMMPERGFEFLLAIYNAMLNTGYFPKKFKEAMITMIPKPGKPLTNPNNYRPVSLLKVPGKINL